MFASVSAWSIAFGAATALDTLCSQAWTGSHDKTLVGVHLQRALVIFSLMFIPIALVWWNATAILLALNQDLELANYAGKNGTEMSALDGLIDSMAGRFLRYLLLGAPAYIAFEATKKFLQAQGIMRASTYVLIIVSPINLLTNYTLVHVEPFRLGFIGAPLATSISYWLMLILLLLYIYFIDGHKAWGGWTRECLRDWWPFLRLAVPGIFMVCSEWWAFELVALAASYLGTVGLAANSILLTSSSAMYTIPFGISVAASNRVGNALGEGHAQKARLASMMALVLAVMFASINSTFFMCTRQWFGYLFTSEPDVVERVSHILPLCALYQIADGLTGVSTGIMRGLGRQKVAAWINLIAYYVISFPLAYFLTFHAGWGLFGLWTGLTVALFLCAIGELSILSVIDWQQEMRKARARVRKEELVHHQTQPLLSSEINDQV